MGPIESIELLVRSKTRSPVEGDAAVGCSCPYSTCRGTYCKHQHAVENCLLVVSSATADDAVYTSPVATDGSREIEERDSRRLIR